MYHLGEIKGEIITYIVLLEYCNGNFAKYSDNNLTFVSDFKSIFTVNLQLKYYI